MTKLYRYLVIGTYISKQTGKPASSIAQITSGTSKSGNFYEICDMKSRETVDGQYKVGTLLTGSMTFTVQTSDETGQEKRTTLKIGSKD